MLAKLEKTLPWQIQVVPGHTKVTVTGTAEPSYLASGLSIKFSGELDKKGTALPKEIEQIEILPPGAKPGVFDTANPDKPVRAPADGTTYEIRTKVLSFKPDSNELTMTIGGKKIVAKTSASLAIAVNSSDIGRPNRETPSPSKANSILVTGRTPKPRHPASFRRKR